MDNLISRQAAIDALMEWEESSVWDEDCIKHRGEPYWVAPSDVIEQLPSAQPEPKWIPATKRLPKIGEEVLLSEPNEMFIAEYHGSGNAEGLWVVDACHHYLADVNKCAWMPLPKSYMRGEQDEID